MYKKGKRERGKIVRKFSEEYKSEAVTMVVVNGISAKKIAKDLGIGSSTLEKWVRIHKAKAENRSIDVNEREELRKLKAENHKLKLERELLKKAAVFFANDRSH